MVRSFFAGLSQRGQLFASAAFALVIATTLHLFVPATDTEQSLRDNYGAMIATQLARLSQGAVAKQDSISLNVLAEQVASDPAIIRVTILAMNGETLADYGSRTSSADADHQFTRPIQLADATAGFVQVTIARTALEARPTAGLSRSALRTLAIFLLAGLASWLLSMAATSDPQGRSTSTRTNDDSNPRELALLCISLFNGSQMQTTRRDALMDACLQHVNAVAELYQARPFVIDGTTHGLMFDYDSHDPADRAFQASCAALVLARMCDQPGGGRYRYSLQSLTVHGEPSGAALSDARLLCALADDHAIALAEPFARRLDRPERLDITHEHSPALADLQSGASQGYYHMRGAVHTINELLLSQEQALRSRSQQGG